MLKAEGGATRHTLTVPSAPGDEYELIVQSIVSQLAKRAGVDTTQLVHDVDVVRRATTNQIDVLWTSRTRPAGRTGSYSKPATTRTHQADEPPCLPLDRGRHPI